MDALQLSHSSSARRPQISLKANSSFREAAAETNEFSKLLASAETSRQPSPGASAEKLLNKLEETIIALEELPLEDNLSPEQQELLAAVLQLLTPPAEQLETLKAESGLKKGSAPVSSADAIALLESEQQTIAESEGQMSHRLHQLTSGTDKEPENRSFFTGGGKEYGLEEIKKMKIFLDNTVEILQKFEEQQASGGNQVAAKLAENLEPLLEKAALLIQSIEKRTDGGEELKVKLEAVPAPGQIEGPSESSDLVKETAPASIAEGPKSGQLNQAHVKNEPTLPVVRMSNMSEDLGNVLRNSLRIEGANDQAQLKVSIFPEHLGQLEIRLSTVDGKVAAQIFTSNPAAKEALELQLNQLRLSLVQQGVAVDRIEISQQQTGQSFAQHAHQEQRFSQKQKQESGLNNKNGYQRLEEEAGIVRGSAPDSVRMTVDYTI